MTPEEIKKLLVAHGLRPIKDRGQNFLLDRRVVEQMTDAAAIRPGDRVLEIGSGLGMLTEILLERGAEVLAIELDAFLAKLLRERFPTERLQIINDDFLKLPTSALAARFQAQEMDYKVVANLPYSITSAALTKLLAETPRPQSVMVMLQREVVERVLGELAEPPQKTSLLSLMVQTYGEPRQIMRVSASSFWPQPKVESAVLQIVLHTSAEMQKNLLGLPPEKFLALCRSAFLEKRKQLKNTLGRNFSREAIAVAFETIHLDEHERPERLSFKQWVSLAQVLMQ